MRFFIIIFLIAFSVKSNAADIESVGSGDWDDPNTWDCTCIPTAADDVIIFSKHVIDLDVTGITITVNSLLLQAGTKTMGVTSLTTLNISGVGSFIVTNDMTLETKSLLTVTQAAITVGGALNWSNNGNIDITGGGNGATLLVEGCADGPGGGGGSNDPDNIISGDLTWCVGDGADCSGAGQGSGGSAGGTGGCNEILPIELLSFDVALQNNTAVQLNWVTTIEINNDYFSIEKSYDGINFMNLNDIKGAGDSKNTIHYAYTDKRELANINYYRLKQVDFDGAFTYSRVREIKVAIEESISIYPNPAENNIFNVKAVKSDLVGVTVYSMAGQEVSLSRKSLTNSGDFTTASYEMMNSVKSFYVVVIQTTSGLTKHKLLVN
ncbi:MAG: hypothetical protein ACI85I_002707 [Arenicella sp.]|jgi:hypothetical protein